MPMFMDGRKRCSRRLQNMFSGRGNRKRGAGGASASVSFAARLDVTCCTKCGFVSCWGHVPGEVLGPESINRAPTVLSAPASFVWLPFLVGRQALRGNVWLVKNRKVSGETVLQTPGKRHTFDDGVCVYIIYIYIYM